MKLHIATITQAKLSSNPEISLLNAFLLRQSADMTLIWRYVQYFYQAFREFSASQSNTSATLAVNIIQIFLFRSNVFLSILVVPKV